MVTFIDNAELQITQNKLSLFLGRIVYCHSGICALLLRSEYMNMYHGCVPYEQPNYVSDRPIRRSQNLIINTIDSRLWYLGVKHRKQYFSQKILTATAGKCMMTLSYSVSKIIALFPRCITSTCI